MENRYTTWLIIAGAVVLAYFLLRGKSSAGGASEVYQLGGGADTEAKGILSELAAFRDKAMGYDLAVKTLNAQTEVAKYQADRDYQKTVLGASTAQQLASLQQAVQNNAISASAAQQATQYQQQLDLYNKQISAQRNAGILSTIGTIGSKVIDLFGKGSSGGGFGGVYTPPFFSQGIDLADWVRSIPVGGGGVSNDPYSKVIIDARNYGGAHSLGGGLAGGAGFDDIDFGGLYGAGGYFDS